MRPAKHVQLRVHLAFQTLDDSYPDVAPHLLCVEQIILNLTPDFRIHIERVILHAQPKLLESSEQDGNVSIPVVCAISGILGGLTACMFLFLELKFSLGLQRLRVRGTQIVQECRHSNFKHKTWSCMFTCCDSADNVRKEEEKIACSYTPYHGSAMIGLWYWKLP